MSCPDELQTLLYVDGELPIEEVAAFEAHLATCVGCRRRVAALRAESELIGEVLREASPPPRQSPARVWAVSPGPLWHSPPRPRASTPDSMPSPNSTRSSSG